MSRPTTPMSWSLLYLLSLTLVNFVLRKCGLPFGQAVHTRMMPVHEIICFLVIEPEKDSVQPLFHAFTGYDVVSAFRGKAKKSAWQTWTVCNEVFATSTRLSRCSTAVEEEEPCNKSCSSQKWKCFKLSLVCKPMQLCVPALKLNNTAHNRAKFNTSSDIV